MAYKVDKPWGHELIFAKTEKYVGKILFVKAGEQLSLQFHREKDETIHISEGHINLYYGDSAQNLRKISLKRGESFHIPPNMIHRMVAIKSTYIFEVSTPQLEDVVRLEDKYGRVDEGAE